MEKAVDILRIRNKGVGDKRAMNETAEGRIGTFIDPAPASAPSSSCAASRPRSPRAITSSRWPTTSPSRSPPRTRQRSRLCWPQAIAPGKTVTDRIQEVIGLLRENMKVQRFTRLTGGVFGEYIHHDGSLGVLRRRRRERQRTPAVLATCACTSPPCSRRRSAARREEVLAELIAKEKAIAKAKAEATGKPPQIAEKIAEGQMKTWYAENVLVEQPFVKDQAKTVGQVLKDAGLGDDEVRPLQGGRESPRNSS